MRPSLYRLTVLGLLGAILSPPLVAQDSVREETARGSVLGAVIGGALGAVIGHQSGETGEGAALGAATGAVLGAIGGRRHGQSQVARVEYNPRVAVPDYPTAREREQERVQTLLRQQELWHEERMAAIRAEGDAQRQAENAARDRRLAELERLVAEQNRLLEQIVAAQQQLAPAP